MLICFNSRSYQFHPWTPRAGRVFDRRFAFDCETTRIDEARPWLTPAYVIGAAFDGERGVFVTREHVAAFWRVHADVPVVLHNSAFDLDVVRAVAPDQDVYTKVDLNRVWDTLLLHRLWVLAVDGHTAGGRGEATLEACARFHLGVELPKGLTDADGREVRTSFDRFLNRPPRDIPAVYLEYLATDVIATLFVFDRLRVRIADALARARDEWGYVSDDWLADCEAHWGPLTHHIQLQAEIVLKEVTRTGLHVDTAARDRLVPELEGLRAECERRLREHGLLVKGSGSQKALQTKMTKLAAARPDLTFPRTGSGRFATSADALADLAAHLPFADDLLRHRAVDKLLGSFLTKLGKPVVRPSFGVLARTGRTTSFGELNAQNLPRDDRVRSCFVPTPGHVFLDLDYAAIELAALAQACLTQFGWPSEMATRINAGADLHRVFAGFVTGKPPELVTKAERDRVKAINFGKPGGMGDRSLQAYARATYGIEFTAAEVKDLSDRWLALFPEMREFLRDSVDTPLALARRLALTPAGQFEHTADPRLIRHPDNRGREHEPSGVLGAMCLKVLGHDDPRTRVGVSYTTADRDFFWARASALADELPEKFARAIRDRTPSPALQRAGAAAVGTAGVFTLTGRLRAAAGYTARHNTIFQGLTSDGAKLALWRVWRAGYRIVNFVHDQLLVEVPAAGDLHAHAEVVKAAMVAGMKEVLPDVRVDVEYAATDRWRKGAKAVFDAGGRLALWSPEPAAPTPLAGIATAG